MQVAPQPHGPAVCFLEDDDLDRRIPNVWGFQLCDSLTTQSPIKSNFFTPLVNFAPLSEDRGLSSYPPQRLSSSCLTVFGPSTAVSAVSDPSVVYCPTPSDPVPFVVLLPVSVLSQLLPPAPAPSVSSLPAPMPSLSLLLALVPASPTPLRPALVPTAVANLVKSFFHQIHLHLSVNNLWFNHLN